MRCAKYMAIISPKHLIFFCSSIVCSASTTCTAAADYYWAKKNKIFGWDKRPYIRDFSFILLYIKHYSFYWQLYGNKAYVHYKIHNSLPPYKLSKSLLVITTVCTVPAFKQLCKMCLTPSVTVSISLGSLE